MDDQHEAESSKPTAPRFQFGLKHLLALPVGVAVFFSIASYTGVGFAILILLTVLSTAGLFCSATRWIAIDVLVALAALVAAALLLPMWSNAGGPAARRVQCTNNLKQIALALHYYHDAHGSFPPAFIADENGRPMHSWRVLILPYLEWKGLYEQYDFDEPWDGPNNRKLADFRLNNFRCPSDSREQTGMTSYVAVVGPGTPWPGSQPTCIKDFTDGTSNTLLVVEVANSGIHWMEPRDLHVMQMTPTINPAAGQGISSFHPGGANAAFADGHVRFLPEDTLPEDLRAILTRSGGESLDLESF